MAKKFGKQPSDWTKTKASKEFIKELSTARKISRPSDLLKVTNGDNGGTWMHEDVAIEFGESRKVNEVQIFDNPQFGSIRTAGTAEEPLFCAIDIARALGYARPADAITAHCKGVCVLPTPTAGGVQQMKFIKEPEVYRLIFKSNAPNAEVFNSWLAEEVLPSIRKTGSYSIQNLSRKE